MATPDLATLKARLKIATADDDVILQNALDWAIQSVQDYTHRTFRARSETHYFQREALDERHRQRLVLVMDDDLLAITSLTNGDGTTLDPDAYVLVCMAEDADHSASHPALYQPFGLYTRNRPIWRESYDAIQLKSAYAWVWDSYVDSYVEVQGTWGATTEEDSYIADCMYRLAEYQYRSRAPRVTTTMFDGTTQTEKLEAFPADVLAALDRRTRLV